VNAQDVTSQDATSFDYDLFVIGAGSGGVRAARVAAGHGAKVAIAEESRIGGTCVIRGCVPKKLYVLASRFRDEFEDAQGFGWSVPDVTFDWPSLVAAKEKEITRLEGLYVQALANAHVEIFRSRARLEGPNAIRLADGTSVSARIILIAAGGAPTAPSGVPGMELAISSNEIFDLPALPRRLIVLGAGYIAVEFASIFVRLGVEVEMCFRGTEPLRGFDGDLRSRLSEALLEAGVILRAEAAPAKIEKSADGYTVFFSNGHSAHADLVLAATGRHPATRSLGLESAGVITRDNGAIVVDASSRTTIPSIYAVGDITDRINLTPVAIREGHAFADDVFGGKTVQVNYDAVPSAVFTTPEIGTVGLTEEEAAKEFASLEIFETAFRPMRATLSGRVEKVYMKIIVDAASDKVLGVHFLGPEAGEMAQIAAIAVKMGARKSDFDATMAVHPTMAEELVTLRAPSRFIPAR
jgi:glutathione reductase (NADPH)